MGVFTIKLCALMLIRGYLALLSPSFSEVDILNCSVSGVAAYVTTYLSNDRQPENQTLSTSRTSLLLLSHFWKFPHVAWMDRFV
ncbi:hypothetical protein EI94DRAFT_1009475 [Lactarius quietus]|nr:hypothetical protein EI94DRAFT_1009475 [Lactarius quietus]